MKDKYLDIINKYWDNIIMMYRTFEHLKPIIEYGFVDHKIYSYPADEYINALSERTRKRTWDQYNDTLNNNEFMVFVRDTKDNKLKSYIFNID